jgi:hypothetical protein
MSLVKLSRNKLELLVVELTFAGAFSTTVK